MEGFKTIAAAAYFNIEKSDAYYLIKHPVQLIPCFDYTISIIAINHKYEALSILEVMSPQRADLQEQ